MAETTVVKMYQHSDRLTVAALMPGVEPEDITVEVTAPGKLLLEGELRGPLSDERQVLLNEWGTSSYHREIALPVPVNGELANVTYRNGVLVVALPIADTTSEARLILEEIGVAQGQRVGNAGHPPHPSTTMEHRAAIERKRPA